MDFCKLSVRKSQRNVMVFPGGLYYNVGVSEVGYTSQEKKRQLFLQKITFLSKRLKIWEKTIDNFAYPKDNDLVNAMEFRGKIVFQKEKRRVH